jgi:hypothetical protein
MTATTKRVLSYIGAGLALAAMLGLGVFYAASTLVAPLWAAIVLWIIWATLFVLGIVWIRRHPLRVLPLPIAAAAGGSAASPPVRRSSARWGLIHERERSEHQPYRRGGYVNSGLNWVRIQGTVLDRRRGYRTRACQDTDKEWNRE